MKNFKKKLLLSLIATIVLCIGCTVVNKASGTFKKTPKLISEISEFSKGVLETVGKISETSKETSKFAGKIPEKIVEEISKINEEVHEADGEIAASVDVVSEPAKRNAYFFDDTQTQVVCDAWIKNPDGEQKVYVLNLNIKKLMKLESGTLYCMQVEQPKTEDGSDILIWGCEYLGYYYVTKDEIYRRGLDEYEETGGYTDEINESIIEGLEANEEEFLEDQFVLINCEEGTDPVENEDGWYSYVEVIGDTHIYRLYYGHTGGTKILKTIWQKGKGLVYYRVGVEGGLFEADFYVR